MINMRKRNIVFLIVAGLLVSGGVAFGIVVVATWGEYAYSNNYYYDPGVSSSWENVSFSSDVGVVVLSQANLFQISSNLLYGQILAHL
jgi:hypothetical protein